MCESGPKANSASDPSFSVQEEAEPTRDEVAVKLAELMAAHRDGMCSSDCSDINDPGSCGTCETLDSAIKVLSAAESQLTALRQANAMQRSCLKCEGHGTIRERIDLAGSYNVRHCLICDGTGREQIQ